MKPFRGPLLTGYDICAFPDSARGPLIGPRWWPYLTYLLFVLNTTRGATVKTHHRIACAMSEFIDAVKNNDIGLAKQYLKAGIDVNSRSANDGTTALYWAACSGHVDLCSLLLDWGADVDIAGSQWGSRPLHAAADRGHAECAYLLIKSGAKVDAQTLSNSDTPLHKAAFRGHHHLVTLLLSNGASTRLRNKDGKTPRQEAQNKKHYRVHQALLEHEQRHADSRPDTRLQKKATTQVYTLERPQAAYPQAAISAPLHNQTRTRPPIDNGVSCYQHTQSNGFVTVEPNCAQDGDCGAYDELAGDVSMDNHVNISGGDAALRTQHYTRDTDREVNATNSNGVGFPQEHSTSPCYPDNEIPESSLILVEECNNEPAPGRYELAELVSTRSQLHDTKLKLRKLEGYTEKLQVCIVKAREKVLSVHSENEQLRSILVSMVRLEEELRAARDQISSQTEAANVDKQYIKDLKQQIDEMNRKYIEINVSYEQLCRSMKLVGHRHMPDSAANGTNASSISMKSNQNSVNGTVSSHYEGDVESILNSSSGAPSRLTKLTSRGLTGDSSDSSTPSPPGAPQSSPETRRPDEPPSQPTHYVSRRPPSKALLWSRTTTEKPTRGPEASVQCLAQAVGPVFASAGGEFMDMLTAALLFQTKSSVSENNTSLLDNPGKIWQPDVDFSIRNDTVAVHTVMEPGKQYMLHISITHKDIAYQLKVILDRVIASDGSCPPADVSQIQLIQNILLRRHNRNVSRVLHGFRDRPSSAVRILLPAQCQAEGSPVIALHTVHTRHPSNLSELVHRARSLKSHPEQALPERFLLQMLYGNLSGLHFLREHSLVHGNLSLCNIHLTSNLQPVISNVELGFCTKALNGDEIPVDCLQQLYTGYIDVMPPEIVKLRNTWESGHGKKKVLSDVFRTADIYVLGIIFLNIICHGWRREGNSTAEKPPAFPSGYSNHLCRLLEWMTQSDYRKRPSPRRARIRTGMLLFGPTKGEVKSFTDCQIWHQMKMMKFLLHSPSEKNQQNTHSDRCQTIGSSMASNQLLLEHEFLTSVTPDDIWNAQNEIDWTS